MTLTRKKRINPVSKKKSRVGKLGIVRLVGADLQALRIACFQRDNWECRKCGRLVTLQSDSYMLLISNCGRAEMAHIRTKRNNGDTLDNVRTLCSECHHREHQPKVVPPKG